MLIILQINNKMQMRKLATRLLLTILLSIVALIAVKQAQIGNFKSFLVIVTVALTLGVAAIYQKHLQNR